MSGLGGLPPASWNIDLHFVLKGLAVGAVGFVRIVPRFGAFSTQADDREREANIRVIAAFSIITNEPEPGGINPGVGAHPKTTCCE